RRWRGCAGHWTRWWWRASRPTSRCTGASWTTPISWPASSTPASWPGSCPSARPPPPPPERPAVALLPPAPFAYPIVDTGRLRGREVASVVDALARAGARLVQLRAKGLSDRALLDMARAALEAARASGARLVVNDRSDVARILGA